MGARALCGLGAPREGSGGPESRMRHRDPPHLPRGRSAAGRCPPVYPCLSLGPGSSPAAKADLDQHAPGEAVATAHTQGHSGPRPEHMGRVPGWGPLGAGPRFWGGGCAGGGQSLFPEDSTFLAEVKVPSTPEEKIYFFNYSRSGPLVAGTAPAESHLPSHSPEPATLWGPEQPCAPRRLPCPHPGVRLVSGEGAPRDPTVRPARRPEAGLGKPGGQDESPCLCRAQHLAGSRLGVASSQPDV